MTEKIQNYLSQLEKEKGIRILLACETGSRAWGFPSPDSDYDVRILYVHEKDWYLSLREGKDSIEEMLENNDLDITGWDLRKSLRLLWKSNPALLERIQSPIVYQEYDGFIPDIQHLAGHFYSRIASMHHYLSMGKKCFEEVQDQQEYKLKKLFYALRTATATKWILDREEMPPIEFQKMLDGLDIDPNVLHRIAELIELKSTISEAYLHQGEKEIFHFIKNALDKADLQAKTLPAAKGNVEQLDEFFRKYLR